MALEETLHLAMGKIVLCLLAAPASQLGGIENSKLIISVGAA